MKPKTETMIIDIGSNDEDEVKQSVNHGLDEDEEMTSTSEVNDFEWESEPGEPVTIFDDDATPQPLAQVESIGRRQKRQEPKSSSSRLSRQPQPSLHPYLPASMWNLSTVWAGNVAIIRREDQCVRNLLCAASQRTAESKRIQRKLMVGLRPDSATTSVLSSS